MSLTITDPPALEPVSIDELKAWARIATADDDALLSGLIRTARQHLERLTGRAFITTGLRLVLDAWPDGELRMPRPPLLAVSSVKVMTAAETLTTVDPASYRVITDAEQGRLVARGLFPAPAVSVAGIVIDYEAGYGPGWNDVPEDLREAVLILAAHLYETRTPVDPARLPAFVASLAAPYRVVRL